MDVKVRVADGEAVKELVREAKSYAATKLGVPDARPLLASNHPEAWSYFCYRIAGLIGEFVGTADDMVRAVYLVDESAWDEGAAPALGVTLILHVARRTASTEMAIGWLNDQLPSVLADEVGVRPAVPFVTAYLVEDAEVASRTGVAAAIRGTHAPALLVWERSTAG